VPYWFGSSREPYIGVTCTDWFNPPDGLKLCRKPGYVAYTVNQDTGPIIAFCKFFLDDATTFNNFPTLNARKTELGKDKSKQRSCKASSNRGDVLLHEMMHVELVVGIPKGQLCGIDDPSFL
jgi:hypothetical protein